TFSDLAGIPSTGKVEGSVALVRSTNTPYSWLSGSWQPIGVIARVATEADIAFLPNTYSGMRAVALDTGIEYQRINNIWGQAIDSQPIGHRGFGSIAGRDALPVHLDVVGMTGFTQTPRQLWIRTNV